MELVRIRLERAAELVSEAEALLEKEMFKSANNRAYYAIEKALSALLISH
ncbi:MAG: HEPN domain-containing protein, partial [Roseburia sp.]|nr:HEPN domain-containing protein [Roseburia sp.]